MNCKINILKTISYAFLLIFLNIPHLSINVFANTSIKGDTSDKKDKDTLTYDDNDVDKKDKDTLTDNDNDTSKKDKDSLKDDDKDANKKDKDTLKDDDKDILTYDDKDADKRNKAILKDDDIFKDDGKTKKDYILTIVNEYRKRLETYHKQIHIIKNVIQKEFRKKENELKQVENKNATNEIEEIKKKNRIKQLENLINRYNLSLDMLNDRLEDSKEYIEKVADIVSQVYILLGKIDRKMTFKKLNERISSTKTKMDSKKEAFDNLKTTYDSIVKNYNEVRTREERLKMISSRKKTRSMYFEYVKYKNELSRLNKISSLIIKLPIVPEVKSTSDDSF